MKYFSLAMRTGMKIMLNGKELLQDAHDLNLSGTMRSLFKEAAVRNTEAENSDELHF